MTIVASHVRPEYAAPKRYRGEWVVSVYMGRAHLVTDTLVARRNGYTHTACGRKLRHTFSAEGRAWDGCEACVKRAVPR